MRALTRTPIGSTNETADSSLTGDFRPATIFLTVAVLRLEHGETLTDDALAPILRCSTRTARRRIARWWAAWMAWERALENDPDAPAPGYPRVIRVQTGGRPGHVVVRKSFERWRRGETLELAA